MNLAAILAAILGAISASLALKCRLRSTFEIYTTSTGGDGLGELPHASVPGRWARKFLYIDAVLV
jgi:hypothetical protein